MAKHIARTTQGAHPWRATARTVFAVVVAGAAMAPALYEAIAEDDAASATGAAAVALAIAGAITRALALPAVETFLGRFLPWLAAGGREDAEPVEVEPVEVEQVEADPGERRAPISGTVLDLGATEYRPRSK